MWLLILSLTTVNKKSIVFLSEMWLLSATVLLLTLWSTWTEGALVTTYYSVTSIHHDHTSQSSKIQDTVHDTFVGAAPGCLAVVWCDALCRSTGGNFSLVDVLGATDLAVTAAMQCYSLQQRTP